MTGGRQVTRLERFLTGSRPASEFWGRVTVGAADECWPWLGPVNFRGYGRLSSEQAHRIAFALANQRAPVLDVLHRCDNPPCCNPAHLFEGDAKANMADAALKGRVPEGTGHWNVKLTPEVVLAMREARAAQVPYRQIAAQFGVSFITAYDACVGRTWRHL